ncbi:hypothetical protein GCM10009623_20240 [Nocardioides aestuarii]|uniref:Uncharacterized protein n=1 Tax=Nocardioides aestuarii TaxID=252231 RepID=A0ABW4TNF7_9ACTN
MSTLDHTHGQVHLDQLRERLIHFAPVPAHDPGVVARRASHLRERDALLARLAAVREGDSSPEALRRLGTDVDHHLQRGRDLAWDDVELELGGSE